MQHSAHPPDVPVPLHLHQHLIKSVFFILAVLADLQWYLIVMLVCIFMKASCENLFMCLFEIHLSFVKRLYNFFFFFFLANACSDLVEGHSSQIRDRAQASVMKLPN